MTCGRTRPLPQEVVPAAEEAGVRLCVHPDDPPRPLFGLPRVVSSAEDFEFILNACDAPANGITFCTGALGAGAHNDVPGMAQRFAHRIHFAHLRNVSKEPDGSFMEADHLGGDVDLVSRRRHPARGAEAAPRRRRRRPGAFPSVPTTATSSSTTSASRPTPAIRRSAACAASPS